MPSSTQKGSSEASHEVQSFHAFGFDGNDVVLPIKLVVKDHSEVPYS